MSGRAHMSSLPHARVAPLDVWDGDGVRLRDNLGDFEPVIERAKTTAHNEGFNVRTLFTQTVEKSGGGNARSSPGVSQTAHSVPTNCPQLQVTGVNCRDAFKQVKALRRP